MIQRLFKFIWVLLLSSWAQAAGFYHLQPQNEVVQKFLDQVEEMLPPKLKTSISQGLIVRFQDLKNHGHYDKEGVILLKSELKEIVLAGEAASGPSLGPDGKVRTHKTAYREAQAAVIHETAHAYDFLNLRPDQERAFIQQCQMMSDDPSRILADNCEVYLKTRTTFSSDPYYLEIAGWPLSPQGKGFRAQHNIFTPRSMDDYELKNPSEHFAVNFEYFLLDPELACRKPSLYNFLSGHFQFRPFNTVCGELTYVNPSAMEGTQVLQKIPLERVYQIHYLHAAKGRELSSRWGHSMFRVVICAPETPMGPDCLKDEYHHLVLSFRAFVGLAGINSWKSLTGAYSTRLFIIPFREVKKSYVAGELRDLVSYPLKLTALEKKRFLERAIEAHWGYDNRYYFLSNNCAVESLDLLRAGTLRAELLDKKLIMPNDLRDLLFRIKMVDEDVFSLDRTRGYFFENYGNRYAAAYSMITGQKETAASVLKHIQSPLEVRRQRYREADNLKYAAAVVILENAAYDELNSKVHSSIFENVMKTGAGVLRTVLDKSMALFHLFSAPYEFLSGSDSGYGIPTESELQSSLAKVQKSWNENMSNNKAKMKLFESLFTREQNEEREKTEKFLEQANQKMNDLLDRHNL